MSDITREFVLCCYIFLCFLIFVLLSIKFRIKHSGRKLDLFENMFVSAFWPAFVLVASVFYLDSLYDKFTRRKSE